MKQVLINRGQVAVENVPAPLVEPGHILVEVAYSVISVGTELSIVHNSGQSLIQKALQQPDRIKKLWDHLRKQGIQKTVDKVQGQVGQVTPTGYSCSGIIIQVGEGITEFHPGDRVACAGAGIANHAEIILVPHNLAVRVPDEVSLSDAATVTLGAIAMQGVRRSDPKLGETAAVIGLGLLGQLTVQLLKAAGCRVIGLDLDTRRVSLARQLGADTALSTKEIDLINEIRHLTSDHGVDISIITASSNSDVIVQQAMEITRKKGRVVVVGAVGLGLKRSPFYEKEIDFLISCSYGPGRHDQTYEKQGVDYPYSYVRWTENRNMQEYLRLIKENQVKLELVLERIYDVTQASQAYLELQTATEKPLGVLLSYTLGGQQAQVAKLDTKMVFQQKALNGKINVAVVGAGNFARSVHLPNLKQLSHLYHIRAVVSATGSNAKVTAQQFNADYASTNYEDVINDPDVDALLICTRHNLHTKQTIAGLRAGKHVYCEKPLVLTERDLSDVLAFYNMSNKSFESTEHNLRHDPQPILMVGFNRRFSPFIQRAKEIVKKRKNPLMMFYRVNAGYLPSDNWVHGQEGGGRALGEGCHMIDLFNFLVDSPVESVNVESIKSQSEHTRNSDNFSVLLRYLDGSVCTLLYTALGTASMAKEYLEIYIDGKVLTVDDFKTLQIYGQPLKAWESSVVDKGHRSALEMFGNAVHSTNTWPIPMIDLYRTLNLSLVVSGCI